MKYLILFVVLLGIGGCFRSGESVEGGYFSDNVRLVTLKDGTRCVTFTTVSGSGAVDCDWQ